MEEQITQVAATMGKLESQAKLLLQTEINFRWNFMCTFFIYLMYEMEKK